MKIGMARLLVRLYPQAWRERYGAEFIEFLAERRGGWSALLASSVDVLWAASHERVAMLRGEMVEMRAGSFGVLVRKPGALLPLGMSLAALMLVLGSVTIYGVQRGGDEGFVAHLWQLLMAGQVLMLLIFAIRWMPKSPKAALGVVGLLVAGILAALAPVYFLRL